MKRTASEILYGRKPVQLFLEKSPRKPVRLWLDRRLNPQVQDKFSRLARGRSIPVSPVDPGQLDRITHRAVHQGVAVEADPIRVRNVSDIQISRGPAPAALLALDAVTDPQNFGAICRTAESFGLGGVIFESREAPPLGGAAYKASAGAIDFLPLYAVSNLAEALRTVKSKGLTIVGLDAKTLISLHELDKHKGTDRVVFVLGSEGRGIQARVKSVCDIQCAIPIKGHVGSLNVSAAAAVACFWWTGRGRDDARRRVT